MAKTIKEMADSYARDYLFSPCGAKAPDEHYTAGANAVLEEVERTISVSEPGLLESNLRILIKELKRD